MLNVVKVLTQKNIKITSLAVFAYKVVCVDDKFTKRIVVYRGENAAHEFTKAILKEYKYCKKVMSKHFNKSLIMSDHVWSVVGFVKNLLIMMRKKLDPNEEKVTWQSCKW